jgi:hypothetical protein
MNAKKAAILWSVQTNDTFKAALLELLPTETLAALAMGAVDEEADMDEGSPLTGITDVAIDALCDRVGSDRARQLCGIEVVA